MFGLIKNLFRKDAPAEAPVVPQTAPSPAPAPARPAPNPSPAAVAAPAPPPAPKEVAPRVVQAQVPPGAPDSIPVRLSSILAKFPENLKAAAVGSAPADLTISVPRERVLSQLAQGSVRLTFAELKTLSPAGQFSGGTLLDTTLVDVPLAEILPRLRPEELPKRNDQRKVYVPSDVQSVFGGKEGPDAANLVVSAPASTPQAGPAPSIAPKPPAAPIAPAAPLKPSAGLPDPASLKPAVSMPTRPVGTAPPAPAKLPSAPAPLPSAGLRPPSAPAPLPTSGLKPATAPVPPAAPKLPTTGLTPKPVAPTPTAPLRPVMPGAPAPAASAAPAPLAQSLAGEPVVVTLGQVFAGWPDLLRQSLAAFSAVELSLPLPEVEPGLRKGRLAVPLSKIVAWSGGAITSLGPAPETTEVELPVAVIAPLVMSRLSQVRAQKRVQVGENIPDMFAGGRAPNAAATVASTPQVPAAVPAPVPEAPKPPVAAPAAAPRPAVAPAGGAVPRSFVGAPQVATIGSLFGNPAVTEWTPQEIVQRLATVKGVAGSLLATVDGLYMASQVPAPLSGEKIAGFMPEIFGRINQFSKDLRLGEIQTLSFSTGAVQCQVFRSGKVCLGILNRAGEAFPPASADLILKELNRPK